MKDSIERIRNTGKSLILRALADRIGADGYSGPSSMPSVNITPVSVPPKPRETTIHNGSEFQRLTIYVEVIIVVSHCCNESNVVGLDFSRFRNLREVRVGNECFEYVEEVKLIGLSKLERVVIGMNSFTKEKNRWPWSMIPNRHFYLKDCERVRELKFGCDSFYDYSVCEIENVPSLEMIEMGDLNKDSGNFYHASLELKSDSERIELMNRLVQFENTSVW